jgi:hypothetical protein
MKKSTLIATCLINCGSSYGIQDIENSIQQTFNEEFSELNFKEWNTFVPDVEAQEIIRQFGTGYRINVRQFIVDLM